MRRYWKRQGYHRIDGASSAASTRIFGRSSSESSRRVSTALQLKWKEKGLIKNLTSQFQRNLSSPTAFSGCRLLGSFGGGAETSPARLLSSSSSSDQNPAAAEEAARDSSEEVASEIEN
ncbi:unnamed protein product [Linum tenue]|uniref:Uncharacterized protein n=1 Tax=Linum tenue TaxID=586396 RepID=A0AAV0S2X3_9ROSI|nr:unnamed protein product [Linum tenue]